VDYRKCFNNSALSSTAKRFSPSTRQIDCPNFLDQLIENQVVPCNRLKIQSFFSAVRELSVGVRVDERERGSLSKGNEESLPSKGG